MARVRIFFVTNRNHVPENKDAIFGPRFNPDGVAGLRFGKAEFDLTNGKTTRLSVDVYPEHQVPAGQTPPQNQGSTSFLEDLRAEMLNARDTLVFIHGFNVSFLEALDAGARLAAEVPQDINVVVFSWPSDGKAIPYMSYYSDREDARASGPALARAYLKLFDFLKEIREEEVTRLRAEGKTDMTETALCQRCIHLLAHSMGNYVLRHGVQSIKAKEPNKLVRMFDQVILAAADEDDDTFEYDEKMRVLPRLARRITVYHNHTDRALIISDKTKANPDRLGSDGPRMLDLLPKKVIIVDCSRIAVLADALTHHSYYINNAAIGADIRLVLEDASPERFNRDEIRPERAYRLRV